MTDRVPDHVPDHAGARFADYTRARLWVRIGGRPIVLVPREAGSVLGTFPFGAHPLGAHPLAVDAVHVVTASDPGPARLTSAENAARHAALVAEVDRRGLARTDTVTGAADGTHAEAGLLVAGLTDDAARALGARFDQDAVFRWTREAWSVLPCDPAAPAVTLGWEVRTAHPRARSRT